MIKWWMPRETISVKRTCQICWEPVLERFNAVIALKCARAEAEFVTVVSNEGCNNWSRYEKSTAPEFLQSSPFILASMSPMRRAAAPTSRKLCLLMTWEFKICSLHK